MDLREKHKSVKAQKKKLCKQISELNEGLNKQEKKLLKKMAKVDKLNRKLKKLKKKLRQIAKENEGNTEKKKNVKKESKLKIKKKAQKTKDKKKKKSKNLPAKTGVKSLRTIKKTPKAVVPVPDKSLRKIENTVKDVVAIKSEKDDLKLIDGIGPKIEKILNENGIKTYTQLAQRSSDALAELLSEYFSNHHRFNTIIWPEQAMLAAAGKFDILKELQDKINPDK